jgi:hypothetical protein
VSAGDVSGMPTAIERTLSKSQVTLRGLNDSKNKSTTNIRNVEDAHLTTQRHVPQDLNLQEQHRCENLKCCEISTSVDFETYVVSCLDQF